MPGFFIYIKISITKKTTIYIHNFIKCLIMHRKKIQISLGIDIYIFPITMYYSICCCIPIKVNSLCFGFYMFLCYSSYLYGFAHFTIS